MSGDHDDPPEQTETEPVASPGVPVEPVESALRRLEDQLEQAQERHLRLAAEFDNFRKRAARERIELQDRAQAVLVLRLLEVLDDLDRLAAQDLAHTGRDVLHEALLLVDRKLRKELAGAGLERIPAIGSPFDPALHEAVSVVPAPDPSRDHEVSAVLQEGYRFRGALVRPARVQVFSAEAGG